MKRRQFLAGSVPAGAVILGGCLGSGPSCTNEENWPPNVQVEELELTPGASEAFDIQLDGITSFRFDQRLYECGSTEEPVQFGQVETSPPPDATFQSCPPTWRWDECTRVTVTVPVHVAPNAETGSYEYGFQIREDIGEGNSLEYEYTITVTGN